MKSETAPPIPAVYRPDIDGLRAVAVLSVVVFHGFPGQLRGGFVGVDVFFVISGYLISRIILAQLEVGRFKFTEFYARRVKRIFPALAVVLAACVVAGWFVLLPGEYVELGKHVAGGAGFVANLVLLSEAGYFDTSAATKPLLHLWSLGIEEQFYVVWPLLLFGAHRLRRIGVVLAVVLIGSFILDVVVLRRHPVAAFYSPLTRFWELLIGASLAYVTLRRPRWLFDQEPLSRNVIAFVGLALIAVAARSFDAEQPFPGWRALLPTVGAYLVISAGPRALVNRWLLSNRVMVLIGLISFPLYLWHWPLLAFARLVVGDVPSPKVRIVAVSIAVVLAWLTYRVVEVPLRAHTTDKRTVRRLLLAMTALLAIGLAIMSQGGFSSARGPWNVANIGAPDGRAEQFTEECRRSEDALYAPGFDPTIDFCHSTAPLGQPLDVLVFGDSHAGRIYSGLRATTTLSLLDLGRASCLPFDEYEGANPSASEDYKCSPTNRQLLERGVELHPRDVVLTGYFARPYDGRVVARHATALKVLMRETLLRVSVRVAKVVVVLDVPELPFDPSRCVERPYARSSVASDCAFDRRPVDASVALYEPDLRDAAAGLPNVSFFDPRSVLCDADRCFGVKDGNLLYDDRNHLSKYASSLVARALELQL